MRGGAHAPLSTAEVEAKFLDNAAHGGLRRPSAERLLGLARQVFDTPRVDATEFRG